jgi:hypothetical protein
MFDDIVLNTDLHLEENLHITHNDNLFNLKRDLRQTAQARPNQCEFYSDIDKNDKFVDDDLDLLSDFSIEADRQAMLDFIRLRPTSSIEHGGLISQLQQ